MRRMPLQIIAVGCWLLTASAALWAQGEDASPTPKPVDELRRSLRDLRHANLEAIRSAPRQDVAEAISRALAVQLPQATTQPANEQPTTQPAEDDAAAEGAAAAKAQAEARAEAIRLLKARAAEGQIDPMLLADALFADGQLSEACEFYDLAHGRGDDASAAWALFQMGNCLRDSDAAAAARLYRRVQNEHGSSPWAGIAARQLQLIDWRLQAAPRSVIKQAGQAVEPTAKR